MPTTIPFDPSLVLGNIADPAKIAALEAIATAQHPLDAAQEKLNSLILTKRSLDMTMQEMINMSVGQDDIKKLADEIGKVKTAMATAAIDYAKTSVTAQDAIQKAREKAGQIKISSSVESPMDYNKSAIKLMGLSSDSLTMDAQYFRNESEKDGNEAHSNAIASYISGQVTSVFGPSYGAKAGSSAKSTALSQTSNHNVQGTLVITANCTHKEANVFAPFVLDPEKAIRAWNVYVPDRKINSDDEKSMTEALEGKDADKEGMFLLSGATNGSSFVGMVHILQTEDSKSSQTSKSTSFDLEASFEEGCFLASQSGKFGVDGSFASSIKSLLSTSNIQAHASVVTMGLIPSIKSNEIKTTVSTLKPDAKEVMGQLAAIQGASDTEVNTMASDADKARAGESFMQLNNSYVKDVVSSLGQIDNANNKVIDTNSMMTAFDDYVQKAIAGECGIPINFFLKPITSKQLAKAWLYKFSPLSALGVSSGDDDSKKQEDEKTK
ncbi:MAG: hypothetical protein HN356_00250 [Calditrichaeota bacterium]|nr:hypothetical protein [Calditrichota bacterium]MBT7789476.1 hypothetical protein [Calditrichota bacterium]